MRTKKALRKAGGRIGLIPAALYHLCKGRGVRILMYHRICDIPGDRMSVSPQQFRLQMNYLRQNGYQVISLDDLLHPLFFKPMERKIIITFDDGYRDWYDHAFPILNEFRFTAVFFLALGLFDETASIKRYQQLPINCRLPITSKMIEEMLKKGMKFESHGMTHRELPQLSPKEQEKEFMMSSQRITAITGSAPRWFAFPRGRFSPENQLTLKRAGYRGAVTVKPGENRLPFSYWELRRTEISGMDNLDDFRIKLNGGFDYWHHLWQIAGGKDRTKFARDGDKG